MSRRPDLDAAMSLTKSASAGALDYIDGSRGEYMGDGIPRDAGGNPYDPLEGEPDPEDGFWTSMAPLAEIRRYARSKGVRVNPWALLGAVLCRLSVAVPPNVVIDPMQNGQAMPLNLYLALIGESGDGKGITTRAAAKLIPDIRDAGTRLPASGEGIPAMFARREQDDDGQTRLRPTMPRSLLDIPEITHLTGVSDRRGSTVISTLLSCYQGERIGAANKNETDQCEIPRLGYRLSIITGVQPAHAGVIIDNATTGFAQRFIYFDVTDPETPINAEPAKRVMASLTRFPFDSGQLPPDPDKHMLEAYYNPKGDHIRQPDEYLASLEYVAFPPALADEFDNERIRVNRGMRRDPLDAHRLQTAARVAALLAILDRPGERPMVTQLEWDNAKTILAKSAQYRNKCTEALSQAKTKALADRFATVNEAKGEAGDRLADDTKARIVSYMSRADPDGRGIVGNAIRSHITAASKPLAYEALADMRAEGVVTVCGRDTGKASSTIWKLKN